MKKIGFLLCICALSVFFYSCESCIEGNGNIVRDVRYEDETFYNLELNGDYDVFVTNSQTPYIEVETDDNIQPFITVRIVDLTAVISTSTDRCFDSQSRVRVYVGAPFIDRVVSNGSETVNCSDLSGNYFGVEVAGNGQVIARNISAAIVRANITGSGTIRISGDCQTADLSILGSGVIDNGDLISTYCTANISGNGDIYTYVTNKLDAFISGVGNIYVYGGADIRYNITGEGDVIPQ